MAKISLPITSFLDGSGMPLANGYLSIRLNIDGAASSSQLCATLCKLALDANGQVTGTPTFWPNGEILPAGTYYILRVYGQDGQLVSGPNIVTI